ncbi:MAG: TolC family protein [Epsilonproteobacteria bacterium]|nr:TolC family protein [Campylobacterota bacterium]
MRRDRLIILLLAAGLSAHAESYSQILRALDKSALMQSLRENERAATLQSRAAQAETLPRLDLDFSAARLKEIPVMYLHFPALPTPTDALPMGSDTPFNGSLRLSYPLFTGYALSAKIKESELGEAIARLKRLDAKRNLYLQTARLYGAVIAEKAAVKAQKAALKAIKAAYKKAKGLYETGLIPPSELYNIEAQTYRFEADLAETKSQKESLLNRLSALLGRPVEKIDPLPKNQTPLSLKKLLRDALRNREDLAALRKELALSQSGVTLAKSRLYPTVILAAALARQGDSPALDGDGYTNADRSYVGASVSWNLFHGGSDRYTIEAARAQALSRQWLVNDYENRIKAEVKNAYLRLKTLQKRVTSAQKERVAREAYWRLTKGRFENRLASADELSRATADLAAARAKESALESEIFTQRQTLLLTAGLKTFSDQPDTLKP